MTNTGATESGKNLTPPVGGTKKIDSDPPSPCEEKKAAKDRDERRKTVKFYTQISLAFVVSVYTFFSGCQAYYTRKQAEYSRESIDALQRQFQLDQRPHIAVTDLTSPSFCTRANERVYITAAGCEIGFGRLAATADEAKRGF